MLFRPQTENINTLKSFEMISYSPPFFFEDKGMKQYLLFLIFLEAKVNRHFPSIAIIVSNLLSVKWLQKI